MKEAANRGGLANFIALLDPGSHDGFREEFNPSCGRPPLIEKTMNLQITAVMIVALAYHASAMRQFQFP